MFTMSAIDLALLILVNIYADKFLDEQTTSVYNNGVMQVSVFVSVNYNGEASKNEIIEYVQKNVIIYSLNFGENVKWSKSTIDNSFHHDIDRAANKNFNASMPPKIISDIRAPLYFTVPGGTAKGQHRWIAKLGGQQTNVNTPLTVTVREFKVSADQLEIVQKAEVDCHILRILKYTGDAPFPDSQKLKNCIHYKGINFNGSGGNSWVSMAMSSKGHKFGIFVDHNVKSKIKIAKAKHFHYSHEMVKQDIKDSGIANWIDSTCLDKSLDFTDKDIAEAWNEGVVMVMVHSWSLEMAKENELGDTAYACDYRLNDFVIQDTFGGRVEVNINWDKGNWYGKWSVDSAKVVYPRNTLKEIINYV